MLPDSDHLPAGGLEPSRSVLVAVPIGGYLGLPECPIGLRGGPVRRTAVPEAAVYEDCEPGGTEYDVHLSADCGNDALVDPEPEASPVQLGTELKLGLGVPAAIGPHPCASVLRGRRGNAPLLRLSRSHDASDLANGGEHASGGSPSHHSSEVPLQISLEGSGTPQRAVPEASEETSCSFDRQILRFESEEIE